MKKILYMLILVAVIVSAVAYKSETVGAPILDLGMIQELKLDNGDIPTIINIICKEKGIDEVTLTETLKCESGLRQYDKGDVLISRTGDVGVGQINLATWSNKAKELNYDLEDPIDNLLMTAWIINNDSRGFKNWVCYNKLN